MARDENESERRRFQMRRRRYEQRPVRRSWCLPSRNDFDATTALHSLAQPKSSEQRSACRRKQRRRSDKGPPGPSSR